jgi:uncharacterized protein
MASQLQAAEVIPPKPDKYFNDYAHVVSAATASRLNEQLAGFERETSSQIVAAIYPKMTSDSSIEDFTVRTAQAWGVGQKDKKNGAVLFVFVQDRKMYLQVGYGLEGAIPDATAHQIIENEIKPHFKSGDFDGGMTAGINAILAAAKGEYKGTGNTVRERTTSTSRRSRSRPGWLFFVVLALILISRLTMFGRRRRFGLGLGSGWLLGSGGWGSSGGGGGGFSSGGGSSGFSSGGGSFGGGGSGGSW